VIELKDKFAEIEDLFVKPEKTKAGCSFGDIPVPVSYAQSQYVILGVPIDITTTFGKTTSRGPESIRTTSAKQIETLVFEKNLEIFEKALIYDIGDLNLHNLSLNEGSDLKLVREFWSKFDNQISKVLDCFGDTKKIPIVLGGEHTITYSLFKHISKNNPLVLHFDAHRDMKSVYCGMEMCHTTPFYHLLDSGILNGNDLVQIGIRQADRTENEYALKNNVVTFDAWYCRNSFNDIKEWINRNTRNREVYISFDIDVYDITYLPCTGTPEPFGLDPFQISDLINSIDSTAKLIGIDLVETGLKNDDFREGTLATQTLLRILT
jgi:agmatinase